ncbi:MAG: hypothetical protein K0S55_1948 [Clostridia bacterium]|nr:hypothetical protein [Clostridia bacterium]
MGDKNPNRPKQKKKKVEKTTIQPMTSVEKDSVKKPLK